MKERFGKIKQKLLRQPVQEGPNIAIANDVLDNLENTPLENPFLLGLILKNMEPEDILALASTSKSLAEQIPNDVLKKARQDIKSRYTLTQKAAKTLPEEYASIILKTIFVGSTESKKSKILRHYCGEAIPSTYNIGIDYEKKLLSYTDRQVQLNMYDTPCQERYRTITGSYFRNANIIIACYSITSRASFTSLTNLLKNASDDSVIILLGNHCEKASQRVVEQSELLELAEQVGASVSIEVDSTTGDNLDRALDQAIAKFIDNLVAKLEAENTTIRAVSA